MGVIRNDKNESRMKRLVFTFILLGVLPSSQSRATDEGLGLGAQVAVRKALPPQWEAAAATFMTQADHWNISLSETYRYTFTSLFTDWLDMPEADMEYSPDNEDMVENATFKHHITLRFEQGNVQIDQPTPRWRQTECGSNCQRRQGHQIERHPQGEWRHAQSAKPHRYARYRGSGESSEEVIYI